eukprot:jgi/Tetstr1/425200/TSEL_015661.t1
MPVQGQVEELRVWSNPMTPEEVSNSAHRRLECAEGGVAIWPMYEGAGPAAREVCGRAQPFIWEDGAGPAWDNPEAFFCPSACTACEPCRAPSGCSAAAQCTACLPGLPLLYKGDCYSECPPGSTEDGAGSCLEVVGSSPPPAPPPPPPAPPTPAPTPPGSQPPAPVGRPGPDTLFPMFYCMDSVQNFGEVGRDCGGPCPVCSAYLDIEVELQGLTVEGFLAVQEAFTFVMADLAAVPTNRMFILVVVNTSPTGRRRLLQGEQVQVSARILAYSQAQAFDISTQLIADATGGGDLAPRLQGAGFQLAAAPQDSFRVVRVQDDPTGLSPPAPPPAPEEAPPAGSATLPVLIGLGVAAALLALLAALALALCLLKRRRSARVKSATGDTLLAEEGKSEGGREDSASSAGGAAGGGGLAAAQLPPGAGAAGARRGAAAASGARGGALSTAEKAAELKALLAADMDSDGGGGGTGPAERIAETHQDRLAVVGMLQRPLAPGAPADWQRMGGLGVPAEAADDAVTRDVMNEMLNKVVVREQARLAEQEASFEGSIEALMRAREAKHRQQLEDLAKIKERFLARTKEIYGKDLLVLDEMQRRGAVPPDAPQAGPAARRGAPSAPASAAGPEACGASRLRRGACGCGGEGSRCGPAPTAPDNRAAVHAAEEKVGNLELELEDCKEQEMMMPGDPDVEAEVMAAASKLQAARDHLARLRASK